jgi:hypothetical protein
LAVRLQFGDGCEMLRDCLVQLLAGSDDPPVDTGLMRDVQSAFSVVETTGCGMYPVAATGAWCAGDGSDHGGAPRWVGFDRVRGGVRRRARCGCHLQRCASAGYGASGACELFRDLAGGLAEFGLPAESFMMFGAG